MLGTDFGKFGCIIEDIKDILIVFLDIEKYFMWRKNLQRSFAL